MIEGKKKVCGTKNRTESLTCFSQVLCLRCVPLCLAASTRIFPSSFSLSRKWMDGRRTEPKTRLVRKEIASESPYASTRALTYALFSSQVKLKVFLLSFYYEENKMSFLNVSQARKPWKEWRERKKSGKEREGEKMEEKIKACSRFEFMGENAIEL